MKNIKIIFCIVLVSLCALLTLACDNGSDTYTVNFIVDGDVYSSAEWSASDEILPDEPSLECRKFLGWFYDEAGTRRFDPSDKIGSDVEVYAVFEADHDNTYVIKSPGCTEGGYTEYTCKNCGEVYIGDRTAATGHSHTATRYEPTCEHSGMIVYICECGDRYSEEIAEKGHDYNAVVTPPTERDGGYTTFTCLACGSSYRGDFTDPLEHEHDMAISYVAPTCEAQGYTAYTCTLCGYRYCDNYADALGHEFESRVVPPSAVAQGYTVFTCTECGFSYKQDYTDPHDHIYQTEVVEPTCTKRGYTLYTCTECGHSYMGQYIDKKDHSYVSEVTEPTCYAGGYTTYRCINCPEEYTDDYKPAVSHNYVGTVTKPSCITGGFTTFVCSECSSTYVGDATGTVPHPYDENVVPPTCYSMGYTEFYCPVCQDAYTGEFKDILDHDIKETVIEPTCTEGGKTKYYCTNCDYVNYDNGTPPLPHSESFIYDDEFHNCVCSECGMVFDNEGPYRHSSANCDCGYVAPVGTVMYMERADGGWSVIDYQGSYADPTDLYIPGTYRGGAVHFSLSSLRADVRSVTLGEGLMLGDLVISESAASTLDELIFNCSYEEDEYYTFSLYDQSLEKLVLPKGITRFYLAGCMIGDIYVPNTVKSFQIGYDNTIEKVHYEGDVADWLLVDYTASDLLGIADEFYIDGELVEDLVIPEGVTAIGENAFYKVKTLKSVSFPSTLTSIGEGAFYGCASLAELDIPSSVKNIGRRAFADCTALSSLTFAEGLDVIECFAFENCTALVSVILPEGLGSIHSGLFFGCDGLRYVYLPSSITNIGTSFDCSCSEDIGGSILTSSSNAVLLVGGDGSSVLGLILKMSYLPYSGFGVTSNIPRLFNTYDGASYAQYFTVGDFGFVRFDEGAADLVHYFGDGGSVIVPNTVEYLGEVLTVKRIRSYAFMNKAITDIHIPEGVTDIGVIGTDTLKNITVDSANESFSVVENVLFTRDMATLVLYPSHREGSYYAIPESVESIMPHAFVNPMELNYVYMPDANAVGVEAFVSCRNIVVGTPEHSTLANGESNYGNVTVSTEGDDRLNYISVGGLNYLTVGEYAAVVSYNGEDTELTVSSTVSYGGVEYKVIGILSGAFFRANSLKSVTVESGIRAVGSTSLNGYTPSDYIFDGSFYFDPRGVWDVTNMHAFKSCDALEAIVLPDSVTDIMGLVDDCDSLVRVELGSGLEYITLGIEDCDAIQSVMIPPSVKTMEVYSIRNCPSLESLTVGTVGMTERNENPTMRWYTWAVYGCDNIKTLVIGDQVGKIDGRIPRSVEVLYAGAGFTVYSNVEEKISGSYKELHFFGDLADFVEYTAPYCYSEHLYLMGYKVTGEFVLDNALGNLISGRMRNNLDIERLIITGDNIVVSAYQFENCRNLYEVVVKGEGASFEYDACPYVTSLIIEGSIASLENRPFGALKTVRIAGIDRLLSIKYDQIYATPIFNTETELYIIGEDTPCYEIVIPEDVTVIQTNAFAGLDLDRYTVILHDKVTRIERWAFIGQGIAYYREAVKGAVLGEWYYSYTDDSTDALLFDDPYTSVGTAMVQYDTYWFKK